MKTFLLSAILLASFAFSTKATYIKTIRETPLFQLLTQYLNVKNALIKGNTGTVALQADEFVKAINSIDIKVLSDADMKAFAPLQEKLSLDAKHIAEAKGIDQQRDHFKSFSDSFYKLAKAVKLSEQPIYQVYCPMKKASWLSTEAAIKNPYFGSQMLTCGKVIDTIK